MVTTVYSKEVLDKYFSIFEQTFADMIVRSVNISHPLHSQKLRKQNLFGAIFDRLKATTLLIQWFWRAINFLCLWQYGLISFLIDSS